VKIRTAVLAAASALALVVGVAAPAGAVHPLITTTYAVGNDHVVCNTVTGTLTFATALKLTGPTTGANTTTVKATVAGCTDTDKTAVKIFTGSLLSTIQTTGGAACGGLLGLSNNTNSSQFIWKPATGQAFSPTVLIGTAQKPVSNVTATQDVGTSFTVPVANAPWSSTYGMFELGVAYGTVAGTGTVDFTGGDGGASGWFAGTSNADLTAILTACGSTAGVKTLAFGIGAVALG
jgi:hypothetical protein